MAEHINLDKLERKVWMRYWQDGLWDLYMGALLLFMGLGIMLGVPAMEDAKPISMVWMVLVFIAITIAILLAFIAGKRFITRPRVGKFKFGPEAKARRNKTLILFTISAILLTATFFVSLRTSTSSWDDGLPMAFLFGAFYSVYILVVFGLAAYFLEFTRLYIIGFLYALPVPVWMFGLEMLDINIGLIAFSVPSAIIIIMGVVYLIRFLRENPIPVEES